MNVSAIINHCKGLHYYDLERFAGENFNVVYDYIKNNHTSVKPNDVLVPTLFTCIAVDGVLHEEEWRFIMTFIGGYSYDEAKATAGAFYSDEAQSIVRKLVNSFPSYVSEAFVKMCIAVLCVDHQVDYIEKSFLNSLF